MVPCSFVVKYLPLKTHSIISVHNSLIVFSESKVQQFQLGTQNYLEVPSTKITSYMEFSHNCTRVLCASYNELVWLHVKNNSIKLSPAGKLPVKGKVSELVKLKTSGHQLSVLCFSKHSESIVLAMNLNSMKVAEVGRWRSPPQVGCVENNLYIGSGHTLIKYQTGVVFSPHCEVSGNSRVFRMDETNFICGKFVYEAQKLQLIHKKTLEEDLVFFSNSFGKHLFVTRSQVALGTQKLELEERALDARAFGNKLFVCFYNSLKVLKDLTPVQTLGFDQEILSLCVHNNSLYVSVDKLGVKRYDIGNTELVFAESIPTVKEGKKVLNCLYFIDSAIELWSSCDFTQATYKGQNHQFGISVLECKLLKDTGNTQEYFLEGLFESYLLEASSELKLSKIIKCFPKDICHISSTIYLVSSSEGLQLAEKRTETSSKSVDIDSKILKISSSRTKLYCATPCAVEVFSTSLRHLDTLEFPPQHKVTALSAKGKSILIASESNGQFFLHVCSESQLSKSIPLSSKAKQIKLYKDWTVLVTKEKIQVLNGFHTPLAEISFLTSRFLEAQSMLSDELLCVTPFIGKFQKVVGFEFLETHKTPFELLEQINHPHFLALTESSLYWGVYQVRDFRVLASVNLDFVPRQLFCESKALILGKTKVYKAELEKSYSKFLLMNKGHQDWRIHKITLKPLQECSGVRICSLERSYFLVQKNSKITPLTD